MSTPTVLVVGLGQPDRGDDAVGPVVTREVAAHGDPRVEAVVLDDPTDLVLRWAGHEGAVVVDAVRTGAAAGPGTVHVLRTGARRPPLASEAWSRTGRGGTHAFGLAEAVELSRALGRLPGEVVVVGVEAAGFEHGAPLSEGVAAAVPGAVRAVLEAVEDVRAGALEQEPADVPR